MKQVVRYDLKIESEQTIKVPFGGEIVKFGMWQDQPAVWILCEPGYNELQRKFRIYADGKDVPPYLNRTKHVGCFEQKGKDLGSVMLHVFED